MPLSRRLRTALVGAVALAAVVVATAMALRPPPADACKNFHFSRQEWRAAHGGRRETLGRLLARCHTLSPLTLADVRRALGPPHAASDRVAYWTLDPGAYSMLVVRGRPGGRVTGVRVEVEAASIRQVFR
jgi:hypothetical protein